MSRRNRKEKEFVIPMAPSDIPNDFSTFDDFSVNDGGGVLTKVSFGNRDEAEQSVSEKAAEKKNLDFETINSETLPVVSEKLKESDFVQFRQLYSSRDGKLRFYEDNDGHIIAVNAAKLV